MIDRHWDGIASYCRSENKVSLGLVEGLNNEIRVLQRRAYGYREEEYLKLKIVAAFHPWPPGSRWRREIFYWQVLGAAVYPRGRR